MTQNLPKANPDKAGPRSHAVCHFPCAGATPRPADRAFPTSAVRQCLSRRSVRGRNKDIRDLDARMVTEASLPLQKQTPLIIELIGIDHRSIAPGIVVVLDHKPVVEVGIAGTILLLVDTHRFAHPSRFKMKAPPEAILMTGSGLSAMKRSTASVTPGQVENP
jgi:hypothetical protein